MTTTSDPDRYDHYTQAICRLIDEIERLPDAKKRLNQAKTVLGLLAEGTNGVVDYIPTQDGRDDDSEEEKAIHALAEAFAAIERWRDYIPTLYYSGLVDVINDWTSESEWQRKPEILSTVMPIFLREAIAEREQFKSELEV